MANPYQLACIAQTNCSFICRSQNRARGTDLKREEQDIEGQSVQLVGEVGGRGSKSDVNTSHHVVLLQCEEAEKLFSLFFFFLHLRTDFAT